MGESRREKIELTGLELRRFHSKVQLDHASVSRLHCSLALKPGGQVVVADLGSANGTSVNGQLLAATEARPVNQGDVIGVGDLRLTLTEIN